MLSYRQVHRAAAGTSVEANMNHVALACWAMLAACAGLIASCGGGSDNAPVSEPAPPALPPVVSTTEANSPAVIALYSAASAHRYAASTPLITYYDGRAKAPAVWLGCLPGIGSMEVISLDGAPPPMDGLLPSGSHTFSVRFSNCIQDDLDGIYLTGTTTIRYSTADWANLTANVSTTSMRATGRVGLFDSLRDVTATGSGTLTMASTSPTVGGAYTMSYVPGAGATLVNNLTTNVITFKGGALLHARTGDPSGFESSQSGFANLAIDLNGVDYVLDGTEKTVVVNRVATTSGEIGITRGGVLVGRIFHESSGRMRFVALAPIVTF